MILNLSVSLIVQGLIVIGLASTASILLRTVVKLAELGRDVVSIDRRVVVLEEK